ncbi:MAG: aldehyde dehydrogenase, partial [Thaumarchaeota archaeon]|nr:aldehyde dehydrogenase [Nitrososphaerota archaeon]
MKLTTINPASEEPIQSYEQMDKAQITQKVATARAAFLDWKNDFEKRKGLVYNLVSYLRKNKIRLAEIAT